MNRRKFIGSLSASVAAVAVAPALAAEAGSDFVAGIDIDPVSLVDGSPQSRIMILTYNGQTLYLDWELWLQQDKFRKQKEAEMWENWGCGKAVDPHG